MSSILMGGSTIENQAFKDVEVIYRDPADFDGETGIVSVTIVTPKGEVVLD